MSDEPQAGGAEAPPAPPASDDPREVVDPEARRSALPLVRQLREGLLTDEAFEERWPEETQDPALWAIRDSVQSFASPAGEEAKPGEYGRALLTRCELFLRGDAPYPWPLPPSTQRLRFLVWISGLAVFAAALTLIQVGLLHPVSLLLGLFLAALWMKPLVRWLEGRVARRALEEFRNAGDLETWPFLSEADEAAARAGQQVGEE